DRRNQTGATTGAAAASSGDQRSQSGGATVEGTSEDRRNQTTMGAAGARTAGTSGDRRNQTGTTTGAAAGDRRNQTAGEGAAASNQVGGSVPPGRLVGSVRTTPSNLGSGTVGSGTARRDTDAAPAVPDWRALAAKGDYSAAFAALGGDGLARETAAA